MIEDGAVVDGPGSTHTIAPPMEDMLERAKRCVMVHYNQHLEKDNVSATQRAVYVLKALDAKAVLVGDRVSTLEAEAATRGVTVQTLAQNILDVTEQTRAVELQRQRVNAELLEAWESNATDPTAIVAVLTKYSIELT